MITVISGTNNKGSNTKIFARHYAELLHQRTDQEVKFLALEDMPSDWFHNTMYAAASQAPSLTAVQDEYILPAANFVIFSPEYNGGFAGSLKLFIDACSIREYAKNFKDKRVALLGVSSGRAGNLRGMEQLTGIFNYLGTHVMPNRLPISQIDNLLNEDKTEITDAETLKVMAKHADEYLIFIRDRVTA
ncbi:MAG: NADPH-dependent oxidoreductase [Bacteroidetes bacterium]|nr:MAG: NADPH-dependent oxidoreductase [Bacteroidota bacterium]